MEIIKRIQDWYKGNCNGEWEHDYGVKIETLDNPGWSVEIDLNDTVLVQKPFDQVKVENGEHDWLDCKVLNNKFSGDGDSDKLERILKIFLEWAQK